MRAQDKRSAAAGFSLIELMIAMAVTLVVLTIATKLLAASFNVRAREDRRADAIADVQRALNIMGREIANSGYMLPRGLTYKPPGGSATLVPDSGLLPGFCNSSQIAVVANLNSNGGSNNWVDEADEGVLFSFWSDPPPAPPKSFLVRKDLSTGNVMVLANRIDSFTVRYFDRNPATGALTAEPGNAAPSVNTVKVRLAVGVTLPAVGTPNTEGFQPASSTLLQTEVALRNSNLPMY